MRYIGSKTKLLGFIGDVLDERQLRSGRALDAFAGTTAVGRELKSRGFTVAGCDIMTYSCVYQRAYLVVDDYPCFDGLRDDPAFQAARQRPDFSASVDARFVHQPDLFARPGEDRRALQQVLVFLDSYLDPCTSFITTSFSAAEQPGDDERMYFSRGNAMRIDAIRQQLHDWRSSGAISEDELSVVLAALLDAADSVANTTGVYAAFVKSWQSNAVKPLRLGVPPLIAGTGRRGEAHRGDVNALVDGLGHFDLLYLDPPYNTRQYSAYYHIPELLARGWFAEKPQLRGKTGLIPDEDAKSAWSSRERCVPALEDLIRRADASHVLMSYNSEGILPEGEIERIFRAAGVAGSYQRVARDYARYRSDSDSDVRQYKADRVTEYLYYVRLR